MSEILVSGSGEEEGNTITLYDQNGNVVGTTQVQEDGTWSIDVANLADNSEFKLHATQTDSVGNESSASSDVTVYQSTAGGTNTYSNDDFVFAGSGNDHVRVNANDSDGQLVVDGGDGTDTIRFDNNTSSVNVNLSEGTASSNDDNVELRNFENAYGGKANDILVGDDGSNLLYGANGDDTIDGGAGNDALYGGNGADTIHGGSGADTLGGGNGNDILYGGAGDDKIHGQNGDDTIIGGAGDDTIRTDGGTDTVVFSGDLSDYTFTYNSSNRHIIVEDDRPDSPDGTDDVYGAEFFQFADQTVSTAIPSAPTVDLIASSDSGRSDSDNITNDTTPTFQITLASGVTAGYVVTLSAGDNEVEYTLTQEDIDNGYAQVTTEQLSDGEYEVSATITNLLGFEGSVSSSLDVRVDEQWDDEASAPTLDISLGNVETITTPAQIDENANEQAGIYKNDDGEYVQEQNIAVDTPMKEEVSVTGVSVDYEGEGRNANNLNINSTQDALSAQNGRNGEIGNLTFNNVNKSTFNLDDTNDTFIIKGNSNDLTLNLGGGNNIVSFEIDPGKNVNISASSGDDVLVLPGNQEDYDFSSLNENNGIYSGQITGADNMSVTINNFEGIVFADGSSLGDINVAGITIESQTTMVIDQDEIEERDLVLIDGEYYEKQEVIVDPIMTTESVSYQYSISLDASLTDTDGSESLSNITLSNLPNGVVLKDASGNEISSNEDGSYTINLDEESDTKITLESDAELAVNNLNEITASITSTENNGGEEITLETNIAGYETLFIEDDTVISFDELREASASNISEINMLNGDQGSTIEGIEVEDLLAITSTNDTDEQIMKIVGDSDDTVKLDGDKWTKSNEHITDDNGNEFDVYEGGDDSVKLYIDTDVVVTDI